jgi:hypothetical protein
MKRIVDVSLFSVVIWIGHGWIVYASVLWTAIIEMYELPSLKCIIFMGMGAQRLFQGLGIKFGFTDNTIEWDGAISPMGDADSFTDEALYVQAPNSVLEATERIKRIIRCQICESWSRGGKRDATHLSPEQRTWCRQEKERSERKKQQTGQGSNTTAGMLSRTDSSS